MSESAETLLQRMLGPSVDFRDGQLEAINALVRDKSRVLVVQRTGWGKSLIYFIATRMLRDAGSGPTILISPLLSLMRNQIEMAEGVGILASSVSSANAQEWAAIEEALERNECDILLVSPERLGNERFLTSTLPSISQGIGLFVVDEAHCISDWGHDFRPDYRRIAQIVRNLSTGVPVLATTATANDRVIADIGTQLGTELQIHRGSLARPSAGFRRSALTISRHAWLGSPNTSPRYRAQVSSIA